ncbi:MAG: FAD-dependent oxidoreductase, partial [Planctomycetota bacterium]|nr:FAD-dependent oxidoreductase [Planctomycetota bacterium]
TGKRQVSVTGADGETVLDVPKIILATGSEPARPGAFPFDGEKVITSDEALRWQQPPASLLIVGGGATGCEFASAMSDFGVEVHIVEMLPQLLPFADPDIALDLQRAFKKRGIKTHTSTKIESMTAAQNVVADLGDQQIEAEVALVCAGRKMNTGGLGLEELGIEMEDSSIQINDHCQTSQESIYAIGDITGKVLLAHVASRQGTVAAEHAMGANTSMDYAAIPGCVFTDPEVAFAGMTREAAEAEGRNVKEAKFPFQMLGKSQVVGELTGFLKMIGDAQTNQVLGVHIIGPHATELIGEGVLAIRLEATVEDLAETVHAHPTFSEAYLEAAELYLGHPIHGRG